MIKNIFMATTVNNKRTDMHSHCPVSYTCSKALYMNACCTNSSVLA